MIEIETRKYGLLRIKQIWYAQTPRDVTGCDIVMYHYPENEPTEKGSFLEQRSKIQCLDLTKPIERIYQEFDRNTQKEIRRARKEAFRVSVNEDYAEFLTLLNKFIGAKKLNVPKIAFDDIKHQTHLLVNIFKADQLLASDFAGLQGSSIFLLWICNSKPLGENKKLVSMASRLAHFEAMKWGKENGYKEFSVGALTSNLSPNKQFKKGFGGYEKEIKTYIKIYNPILKLLNMALKIL